MLSFDESISLFFCVFQYQSNDLFANWSYDWKSVRHERKKMKTGNEFFHLMLFQRLPRLSYIEAFELPPECFRGAIEILSLSRKVIKQLSDICLPSFTKITSTSQLDLIKLLPSTEISRLFSSFSHSSFYMKRKNLLSFFFHIIIIPEVTNFKTLLRIYAILVLRNCSHIVYLIEISIPISILCGKWTYFECFRDE